MQCNNAPADEPQSPRSPSAKKEKHVEASKKSGRVKRFVTRLMRSKQKNNGKIHQRDMTLREAPKKPFWMEDGQPSMLTDDMEERLARKTPARFSRRFPSAVSSGCRTPSRRSYESAQHEVYDSETEYGGHLWGSDDETRKSHRPESPCSRTSDVTYTAASDNTSMYDYSSCMGPRTPTPRNPFRRGAPSLRPMTPTPSPSRRHPQPHRKSKSSPHLRSLLNADRYRNRRQPDQSRRQPEQSRDSETKVVFLNSPVSPYLTAPVTPVGRLYKLRSRGRPTGGAQIAAVY